MITFSVGVMIYNTPKEMTLLQLSNNHWVNFFLCQLEHIQNHISPRMACGKILCHYLKTPPQYISVRQGLCLDLPLCDRYAKLPWECHQINFVRGLIPGWGGGGGGECWL